MARERRLLGQLTLAPVSAAQAREWLGALVTDLLGGVHDYLLLCEAVIASHLGKQTVLAEVEQLLESDRASFSSRYGPVRRLASYAPPEPGRIEQMVERRFAPFFQSVSYP